MSEPRAVAQAAEEVVPGLLHWGVSDERIGGSPSDAYAVDGVLVDPLPLAAKAFAALGPVRAIVLTAATHQRSAWRLRRDTGAEVWLPEGSRATDEEPDRRYGAGDLLPGDLRAVHAPGPELPHYALLRERAPRLLFCPDLVMRGPDGALRFVPPEYHEDPAGTRRSVERLLDLEFDVLCLAHGAPVTDDPHAALRAVLGRA
jgi:hypothetical protein